MNVCYIGDCRETMRRLASEGVKVQTCVTSPPYWGLRDYNVGGQLGLEATPAEYVANMVEVFGLVHELLADDGTCWLNMGDSYFGDSPTRKASSEAFSETWDVSQTRSRGGMRRSAASVDGLKRKELCGIPWRLAFALQADGWYLRSDIIWHKPNPMPESVTDRPTKSHEYLFLLSKQDRYYYDHEAIKEEAIYGDPRKPYAPGQVDARGNGHDRQGGKIRETVKRGGFNGKTNAMEGREAFRAIEDYRNKRSVWTVPTVSYSGAHFATYPPALIEPCILAGSRVGDIVLDPFFGSGTTGQVAQDLGRKWIGCEINPEYATLQERRCAQQGMAFI